jgi:hypothetical protein
MFNSLKINVSLTFLDLVWRMTSFHKPSNSAWHRFQYLRVAISHLEPLLTRIGGLFSSTSLFPQFMEHFCDRLSWMETGNWDMHVFWMAEAVWQRFLGLAGILNFFIICPSWFVISFRLSKAKGCDFRDWVELTKSNQSVISLGQFTW